MLAGHSSIGQCISAERPDVHIVQKGDTLYSIASKYGFDYRELAKLNGIRSPGDIYIGLKIQLHRSGGAPVARSLESKPAELLVKDQPKVVMYRYSDAALAHIDKIREIAKPDTPVIAKADSQVAGDLQRAGRANESLREFHANAINQISEGVTQEVESSPKPVKTRIFENMQSMDERWMVINKTISPKILLRLCQEFKQDYPTSKYSLEVEKTLNGAQMALHSQRAADLADDTFEMLYDRAYVRDDLVKALRGDKDSAYRVANMYREGGNGLPKDARRIEQWLRFSAELGNGTACWELAELYLSTGLQADAAKYEYRAIKLGYVPQSRLSNRNY
jgi:LysM repeat protein